MKRALLFTLAVGAAGCGHTETHEAMFRAPERPSGRTVELYMADQAIPLRPYYEIALVQAIGFGSESHPEDLAQALAEKAGKLGCDAVVRTFVDQGYSRANACGVCVKWVGEAPPGTAPGPTTLPAQARPSRQPIPLLPAPAPRMESLPSAGGMGGGGR